MRTFKIVLIIVLLFLLGWYFVYESIDKHATSFVKQLDNISDIIREENWDMVSIEYGRMKNNWNKIRKLLTILLDHHEIDNIDLSIARANQYIETKNIPLSLGEIEVLKQLFNIVKESESLTLTNVF